MHILPCTPEVARLPFEAADRIVDKLLQVIDKTRPEAQVTTLSQLALHRQFSFEAPALRGANRLSKTAQEHQDNAAPLAWQASIKLLPVKARLEPAPEPETEKLSRKIRTLGDRAPKDAPSNPLVMALAARIDLTLDSEVQRAKGLARKAVARSPGSAFAWKASAKHSYVLRLPMTAWPCPPGHGASAKCLARCIGGKWDIASPPSRRTERAKPWRPQRPRRT